MIVAQVIIPQVLFFEPVYIPQALNTGTCIRLGDLFNSAGLHRNHVLAKANTGEIRIATTTTTKMTTWLWLIMLHHHTKLETKCSVSQIMSSGQTFTDILNLRCTLTLNAVIPFSHRTLQLMILYYQTKFGCKRTSNFEDTAEIVMVLLCKPSLWPSHWTQWTSFSAWHAGLWYCITIPGLVTKCSVVLKISFGQTFTNILNLCCGLDLECRNPIFPQNTPTYDAVLSNHVWLQTNQQFRRYSKNSHILIIYALAVTFK